MNLDPLAVILNSIADVPFLLWVVLVILIVMRVAWPALFAERMPTRGRHRRNRRWRRRRYWDD